MGPQFAFFETTRAVLHKR